MDLEIVQLLQDINDAGGVDTVAGDPARVFSRYGLPHAAAARDPAAREAPE